MRDDRLTGLDSTVSFESRGSVKDCPSLICASVSYFERKGHFEQGLNLSIFSDAHGISASDLM